MDCCSGKKKSKNKFWKNPIVIFALIGLAYWIYQYHWEHALGFLPYAIILLCPLMHIFMHKGHGHGDHSHHHGDPDKNPNTEENK